MAFAISTLHRMRFLHRDVKPHNILLRADGYYALTDFGLAMRLDAPEGNGGRRATASCEAEF